MPYFDCLVTGSWMFVIGWYVGAIYMQNRNEKRELPRASKKVEKCTECEAWRVLDVASAAAD